MKICSISGCERPAAARGWCRNHYMRFRRHGDPVGGQPTKRGAIEVDTRFGRLVVLASFPEKRDGGRVYLCRCDCGEEKAVAGASLRRGLTRSCGCLRVESGRERLRRCATKHGLRNHPLYTTWLSIRKRCNNPNHRRWKYYGARGITVDPRWDDFAQFLADMGERPGPGYSVDRVDNDGPYSPENCRWATRITQARGVRKLSDDQVRAVRNDPRPARDIATAYGISRNLVWGIRSGRLRASVS